MDTKLTFRSYDKTNVGKGDYIVLVLLYFPIILIPLN